MSFLSITIHPLMLNPYLIFANLRIKAIYETSERSELVKVIYTIYTICKVLQIFCLRIVKGRFWCCIELEGNKGFKAQRVLQNIKRSKTMFVFLLVIFLDGANIHDRKGRCFFVKHESAS